MNRIARRTIVIGLIMSQFLFTSFAYDSQSTTTFFPDVNKHWAKDYIEDLVTRKVVSGYPDGSFRPDGNITVAEFTKILMGEVNAEESVTGSIWFDKYVKEAKSKGVIVEDEFSDYEALLKRKEAVRLIDRFLGRDVDSTFEFSDQEIFGDDLKSIYDIASLGIISGYPDGSFRPNDNITRGEVSKLIYLINNMDKITERSTVTSNSEEDGYWTDEEFIEFMNEEVRVSKFHNKTKLAHLPYINGIFIDKEGQVTFADNLGFNANYDFEKYERSKWIKPLAYNLTKRLGYYAKENGNHVHFTNGSGGEDIVKFEYYQTGINTTTAAPCFSITMTKDIQTHAGKGREYNIGINIYNLANWYDKEGNPLSLEATEKIKNNNYISDHIKEALRLSVVEIFGEKGGNEFTKYVVENYIKRVSDKGRKTYIETFEKINVGMYEIKVSDYVDRTNNTWGYSTYYNFLIK